MPRLAWLFFPILAGACAAAAKPAAPPQVAAAPEADTPSAPSIAPAQTPRPGRAHRLVVAAVGCWFGGVWHDALNESSDLDRCSLVLEEAYGAVDEVRLERLRALDAVEVDELGNQVASIAHADAADEGRVQTLVALLNAAAHAQHETTAARRAGDRIKKDIAGTRAPGKKPDDERSSVAPLVETGALGALFRLEVGPLGAEARAIALMCAMDRMQTAKDLPKHLKVYAVGGAYDLLFGVKAPQVPDDATQPMRGGLWLGYLSEVAKAAGHPVPARATSLFDRERLAWGGVLQGMSDKLRVEAADVSEKTELRRVTDATVDRLDIEYRASQASLLAKGG